MKHVSKNIVISRKSNLAKIQVQEILSLFPDSDFNVKYINTFGDIHLNISLLTNVKNDFFTDSIDEKLLNKNADLAVHSAKDLPFPLNKNLKIVALTKAEDKTDALVSKNNLTLIQLPVNAKIGTSSVLRQSHLLKIRPDINTVSIRGNIEERIAQVDSGKVDAIVVATCALKRLGLENRITEILPFETHSLQGNLAVVAKRGRADLIKLFYPFDIRNKFGKVWLVGAGAGNSDFISLKAHKVLKIADIIFYDDLLDINIIDQYFSEKVYVGKRKGIHSFNQNEINEMLYQNALKGKIVVRLKGGDPFIFGRGGEETAFLKERLISTEVIPGISAFNAAAAAFNIPLTQRNVSSSIELHTAHSSISQKEFAVTKVFYMGASKLSEISKKLLKENIPPETPVALIHNTGSFSEKAVYTTVSEMPDQIIKSPALVIIGKVVELLNPPEKILYTGLEPDYSKFNEKIVHYPLIKVSSVEIPELYLQEYDAIIFTSKSAVKFFFSQSIPPLNAKTGVCWWVPFRAGDVPSLKAKTGVCRRVPKGRGMLNVDCSPPFLKWNIPVLHREWVRGICILSIGPETAKEINRFGYKVCHIPEKADSDSLVELVKQTNFKKILYPCSNISQNALHKLKNVYPKIFYKTEFIKQPKIDLSDFTGIVFSSPSTVSSFLRIYKTIPKHLVCYVFGKHTQKKLENNNANIINID